MVIDNIFIDKVKYENYFLHLQGESSPLCQLTIGKIIIQGYYRLSTTILSDTYKYVNNMFRPLLPSSGWIQYQRKTT